MKSQQDEMRGAIDRIFDEHKERMRIHYDKARKDMREAVERDAADMRKAVTKFVMQTIAALAVLLVIGFAVLESYR